MGRIYCQDSRGDQMTCDICQCRIYPEDQQYRVYAKESWWHICALCGQAAENLGHRLEIV